MGHKRVPITVQRVKRGRMAGSQGYLEGTWGEASETGSSDVQTSPSSRLQEWQGQTKSSIDSQ